MSLPETVSFDNSGQVVHFSFVRKFFLAMVIVLVALLAFGLGRLSAEGKREPVKIINAEVGSLPAGEAGRNQEASNINQTASVINTMSDGEVYASSKGTKYYYSYCKSTVSDKNKVVFASAKQAESAGYTLSATCKPR
ncbi:MAG: hypothetical protein ACYC1K_01250 [Minisyncoccota bacterium]